MGLPKFRDVSLTIAGCLVSAHLLAVTPTAHWLEYVDWANAILTEPLRIEDGYAIVSERPGNGLDWDPDAVRRYLMS